MQVGRTRQCTQQVEMGRCQEQTWGNNARCYYHDKVHRGLLGRMQTGISDRREEERRSA